MNTREADMHVEKLVAQRIDQHLLKHNIKFERVTDQERQVKGIDIILSTNTGKHVNVDEKAKYVGLQDGETLWNYSFELNRICRDGKRRLGWFLDPQNETDIICYAFPKFNDPSDATSGIKPNMRVEYFYKSEVKKIVQRNITIKQLYSDAKSLAYDFSKQRISYDWFSLYRTPEHKLWEEPVNLIVAKGIIHKTKGFKAIFV